MNHKIEETKVLLTSILEKLEGINANMEEQEEILKEFIRKGDLGSNFAEIYLQVQKSAKTSIELLKDEVEELHQVLMALFYEFKNGKDEVKNE